MAGSLRYADRDGATQKAITAWLERTRHKDPWLEFNALLCLEGEPLFAIARDATPSVYSGEPVLPEGMEIGTPVVVLHDEYGSGTVAGRLDASDLHEIAIRRQTERAGELVVHFPRDEFTVIATG